MGAHRTRTETIDCDCSTFTRPHGTQHGYQWHGCGCDACRQAYKQYLVQLRLRAEEGYPAYVDAGPVRAHLHALARQGITVRDVAARVGYTTSALYSVSRSAHPRCRRELAVNVLAVCLNPQEGEA